MRTMKSCQEQGETKCTTQTCRCIGTPRPCRPTEQGANAVQVPFGQDSPNFALRTAIPTTVLRLALPLSFYFPLTPAPVGTKGAPACYVLCVCRAVYLCGHARRRFCVVSGRVRTQECLQLFPGAREASRIARRSKIFSVEPTV
jgi:hypothetical protein